MLADTSKHIAERQAGLLIVIRAHWERSAEAWNRPGSKRGDHGTLPDFTRSWLVANGDRIQETDVVAALRRQFPPPDVPMIGPGRSYWGTGEAVSVGP